MYYIRQKSDNLIQYQFSTEPEFKGYLVKPLMAMDIRPETHEVIQIDDAPPVWYGGLWAYDGAWTVANQDIYDRVLADEKAKKSAEINTVRYSKIYMESIPYTFPGDTEPDGIQMRDEVDRQNIQDFVIDASVKNPEALMNWMPVSNNLKTMTAAQAVEMGQYIKNRGDQIMAYSWQLKAQINDAETYEALDAINIQEGWPI
jgi:hypothetical protein